MESRLCPDDETGSKHLNESATSNLKMRSAAWSMICSDIQNQKTIYLKKAHFRTVINFFSLYCTRDIHNDSRIYTGANLPFCT